MKNKNIEQAKVMTAGSSVKYKSFLHQTEMKAREAICEIVHSSTLGLEETIAEHRSIVATIQKDFTPDKDSAAVIQTIDAKFAESARLFEKNIDVLITESAFQIKEVTDLNKRILDSIQLWSGRSYQAEKHCEMILKSFTNSLRRIVSSAESKALLCQTFTSQALEFSKKMLGNLAGQTEGRQVEQTDNMVDFSAWVCEWWKQSPKEEAA